MPYTLIVVAIPATEIAPQISSGQTIVGRTASGSLYPYWFEARARSTFSVVLSRAEGPSSLCMELVGPNGRAVGYDCGYGFAVAKITATLMEPGLYTVVVSEAAPYPGTEFSVSINEVTPPSETAVHVSAGQRAPLHIERIGEVKHILFDGARGMTANFSASELSTGARLCFQLTDPLGSIVQDDCSGYNGITQRLQMDGIYSLRIWEGSLVTLGRQLTGDVEFTLAAQCVDGCVSRNFAVSTTPLRVPVGKVGVNYITNTLLPISGRPPYSWSASSLPPGLHIEDYDGVIAGIPERSGMFDTEVLLRDGSGIQTRRTFRIAIADRPTMLKAVSGGRAQFFIDGALLEVY